MGAVAILCLLPLLHVAFASVSDAAWVMNQSGIILWPHGFNLDGYKLVFATKQLMNSYGNTILYVFAATGLGMLITVLGAYPLSKKELLWSNMLMLVVSFTMLFNGGIIAFYMVVRNIGLFDTRWAVILPTCVSAFNFILVRTSMSSVPKALEESAMLDGAGPLRDFIPNHPLLIKATLATVVLYYAVAHWNAWFNASIFLQDRNDQLQLVLREVLIANDTASNATSSGEFAGAGLVQTACKILHHHGGNRSNPLLLSLYYEIFQKRRYDRFYQRIISKENHGQRLSFLGAGHGFIILCVPGTDRV